MQTKSDLYALDKWSEKLSDKTTYNKNMTEGLTSSNLLSKGVGAAALFINTFSQQKIDDDEDLCISSGMLKGRCYIKST